MNTEEIDRRIEALQSSIDDLRTMVDPARGVLTAQYLKMDGPSSSQIIRVNEGGSLDLGSESSWRVVGAISVPVSHTGDTVETEIASIPIPGGRMGPNGFARIHSMWDSSATGANHTYRVYFGQIDSNNMVGYFIHGTRYQVASRPLMVGNQNDVEAQAYLEATSMRMDRHAYINPTLNETAEDTDSDVTVYFTAQTANAAHTVYLYSALVEVCYRD